MSLAIRITFCSTALFAAVVSFAATSDTQPSERSSSSSRSSDRTDRSRDRSSRSTRAVDPAGNVVTGPFSVVAEKNIFLRDRTKPAATTQTASTAPAAPRQRLLEETLALTGIVFEDGGFRAYVEDVANDKILRLAPGDSIAHGAIDAIEIDAVSYDQGGKRKWIDIGSDFTGKPCTAFSSSSYGSDSMSDASSGSGDASTSQPAVNPNDPNLTVEQRMKLRAQQERGRR